MNPLSAYEALIGHSRELGILASCSALLGWDEQTYLPPGGTSFRSEQLSYLAGLQHERATAPHFGELLAIVEDSDLLEDGDGARAANVRELRRSYDRQTKLPRSLVEDLARATSLAQQEWISARRDADYGRFRPWLERIVHLKRQEGECLRGSLDLGTGAADPALGTPSGPASAYDPLLDEFEPGARTADLAALFEVLRKELVPLVHSIGEAAEKRFQDGKGPWDREILSRAYPADRQKVFGETVAAAVGFDFDRGRLDVTAHPFCTGIGPGDTRITTRYDDHEFGEAFFGILHEVGHGLYEQGLPQELFGTPLGESASLGVHESQSRLWENAVGRSRAFWSYWFPLARQVFHQALRDITLDQFLVAVNHVKPTLIRIQSDEVTYNLHIIIRFELEQGLISGDLPAAELPAAWDQKYRELLGIVPSNDAEGCLQDIHWSAGLIGYFPTYTLGNLYAAQLYAKARESLGNLEADFARGNFAGLREWLRENIHKHGRRYRPAALIERATGERPDPHALLTVLKTKHEAL